MWYNWPKTFLVSAYSSWISFLSWFHITVSFLISVRLKEYICYSLDYLGCTNIFSYVFFLVVVCLSNCTTNGENGKREEWNDRERSLLPSLRKNEMHKKWEREREEKKERKKIKDEWIKQGGHRGDKIRWSGKGNG